MCPEYVTRARYVVSYWIVSQTDYSLQSAWASFVHDIHSGDKACQVLASNIQMHPAIDRNPNDHSTIYSMLLYIAQQCQKLNIPTSCVTYDLPLWLKAIDVVNSKNLNVICWLGPFHTLVSFLGSIGYILSGSGLAEVFETCYGANKVLPMLSGKQLNGQCEGTSWLKQH